jgi:long-chain acyl-CoA synthetase
LRHALDSSATDLLLTDQTLRIAGLQLGFREIGQWDGLTLLARDVAPVLMPIGTAKISFTSGSTGQPKGVCLAAAGLLDTAVAVEAALTDLPITRHLALLPLALLLENVAGLYAALLRGAEIMLPKLADLGWRGMGGFDALQLQRRTSELLPDTLILVPELLKAWTLTLRATQLRAPDSLKFVAVGGARCDVQLLDAARAVGLPVHEGYGMTECGSVVCLDLPGGTRPGSVGRPLPQVRLSINAAGEIHLENRAFLGYLNAAATKECANAYASGDLGRLDADGYLYLSGRKGNLIITGYGRNIAPEWIESALLAQPEIAQAVVVGEARAWLAALLVAQSADADLAAAVARVNAGLPDYARLGGWLVCAPFTPGDGLATGNGRPVRAAIQRRYAAAVESLYAVKEPADVIL